MFSQVIYILIKIQWYIFLALQTNNLKYSLLGIGEWCSFHHPILLMKISRQHLLTVEACHNLHLRENSFEL